MYDFRFGSQEQIDRNEDEFLLFVKRLLPRWANSIPDSEFLALHAMASKAAEQSSTPVLVETGCGASTLALVNVAMRRGGRLLSWDTNGSKGSFIRSVIADVLEPHHKVSISEHWKFVGFSSVSPHLGLAVLAEMGLSVDFAFLDGEHTLQALLEEVRVTSSRMRSGSVLVIDDANFDWTTVNFAFVNMQRAKLSLPPIDPPQGARGPTFKEAVEEALHRDGWMVTPVANDYAAQCEDDIYFPYYRGDRAAMHRLGMEKGDDLQNRVAAFQVRR